MDNLLNISEAANLAIHALAYMASAGAGELWSASQIGADIGVSESHLSKVLQRLVPKGLVESTRGAKGGFKLGRSPEKVSVLDVIEAVDGKIGAGGCLLGRAICKPGKCVMRGLLPEVEKLVRKHLEGVMLSEFDMKPSVINASRR